MSKSVIFTFRGNIAAADIATLQAKVEASVRSFGASAETGVQARLKADGLGVVEVTNVPEELEEQVRTAVSDLLVAAHEAVISED